MVWGDGDVSQELKVLLFIKYSIHHPLSADTSFMFLALILFEIRHLQNSFLCFSKGRKYYKGDN